MDWYYILAICLGALILLVLLISYICFKMTFYSKDRDFSTDKIEFPDDGFYKPYKEIATKHIMIARQMPHKELSIKSYDGLTLKGNYFEKSKGAPIEIMVHGYKGSGERDLSIGIERAFRCDRNALVIDQRAAGHSEGNVITFGIKESKDILCWIDKVIEEFGQDVKIILTGISMGAATVLITSGYDLPSNVKGVLADCGFNNAKDIIKKFIKDMKLPPNIFYPFVKLGGLIFGKVNVDKTSATNALKKAKLPIIFIHGKEDSVVPYYMSEKMYESYNGVKKLVGIEKADHGVSYMVEPDYYVNELNDFFKDI